MPKILLGVSIALISASAVLGFLTKQKVEGLNTTVKQTSDTLSTTRTALAKSEKDRGDAEQEAKAANEKATGLATELSSAKAAADKAQSQVTDLTSQIASKDKEIADLKASSGKEPGLNPPIDSTADQVKIKELETKLAEKEQLVNSLTAKQQEAENRARVLAEKEDKRQRQFMAKGLEGQVLAVNQAWNFVVLSIGDKQGVSMGAQMIVKRGDQMIAKVRITSVEPSTAIADIIPGSPARGVRVMPGDRVVYTGS